MNIMMIFRRLMLTTDQDIIDMCIVKIEKGMNSPTWIQWKYKFTFEKANKLYKKAKKEYEKKKDRYVH